MPWVSPPVRNYCQWLLFTINLIGNSRSIAVGRENTTKALGFRVGGCRVRRLGFPWARAAAKRRRERRRRSCVMRSVGTFARRAGLVGAE